MVTTEENTKTKEEHGVLIKHVEGRLELCYNSKRDRLEEAKTILLAQEGYYVRAALDAARGEAVIENEGLPSWFEDRSVLNVMAVLCQTAASVITANNPTWMVDPIGDNAHKYQAARGVSKLLQYFYNANNISQILDDVAIRAVLFNTAGFYVDWDSEALHGALRDSRVGREGWFVIKPVDLFNLHWEPHVGGLENAHWCIYESTMHIDEARMYWDDGDIDFEESHDDPEGTAYRHLRLVQDADRGSATDPTENSERVRVVRYWQKPGFNYPNGLEVVVAGNKVVEVNEELLLGEFPVYMMQYRPKPYRDYGGGMGSDLLRLQEDVARTLDAFRARRDQEVRPPWMVPRGSLTRGGLSTRPGSINEYNQRLGQPTPLQMNPFSHVVGSMLDREISLMEYTAGINDALRGEAPTSNATGRLTAFLAELDARKIGPAIRSMSQMLSQVGRRMIRLWQKYGSESVTVTVMGDGHTAEVAEITKEDLVWADINVDVQSLMPRTQPLRQETILTLLQQGIIEKAQALDALEFGGFDEAVGTRSVEAINARAENDDLADFSADEEDTFSPNEYEDHAVHINEHIKWVRMERPGKTIFDRFKAHIDAHLQFISQEQAGAEQQSEGPQAGPGGQPMPGVMAEPGGLPPEMMPMVEPGVDTEEESALASMAGIEGI